MGRRFQGDGRIDVLQWPVVGSFLRWRHARTAFQIVLFAIAALVVVDGIAGSRVDPTNFATVLTWVHYRGLLVVALLGVGNLFCTGCPFVLARDAGRRVRMPTLTLPRWLRTKWVAVALFAAVLFCYELFDLWALPRATAYLVLAYFGSALTVDLIFRGASFCKYFCPIGQFNFVASAMSPLELRVKDVATCHSCRTADCIKGNDLQRGCELRLFLPQKVGNLDCTLCLDCVHACPHDNIALAARLPGAELTDTRRRSGIGRLARRWDIAALVVLFVFGSLMNAFGMVAPVGGPMLALLFVAGLVVAPVVLLGLAGTATGILVRDPERVAPHTPVGRPATTNVGRPFQGRLQVAATYSLALVPFGFGMWLAHYGFHLLTGAFTIVPVTQRAAVDLLGWPALGDPLWRLTGMRPGSVFPIQVGLILLGAFGSYAAAFRISDRDYPTRPTAAFVPWALLITLLAGTALWIIAQPMDMRGVGLLG